MKHAYRKSRHHGFSLIELMIVMVIALVMSIAVFGILASSEGKKRTLTTVNDVNQAGNYAMYQLDKAVRSAGSGFAQSWTLSFGCELFAYKNGAGVILPYPTSPTTGMAPPFTSLATGLSGVFRLAPIVIAKGATSPNVTNMSSANSSDALIVMSGAAGYGEFPIPLTNVATASKLTLPNTVSMRANDLALLVGGLQSGGSAAPCMIEQVASTFTGGAVTAMPLAGTYYQNPIGAADMTTSSTTFASDGASVLNLGNAVSNNPPSFQLIGVGDNNVLYSYDLLQGGATNKSLPIADGAFEMHALYDVDTQDGVDTLGKPHVHAWVDPAAAGFDLATLESGSAAANANLHKIKGIRLGLILRTSLPEKPPQNAKVAPATTGPLILFSDLTDSAGGSLQYTRKLSTAEQNYRYRTIEATIPLRNLLF